MQWPYSILFCFALAACGGDDARRSESVGLAEFTPDQRPLVTTLVYECSGFKFVARPTPDAMMLWLEDRYVALPQVRSASGTLYAEGDVSFWSKGDEAMLTVAGQTYQNCKLLPARVPWEEDE